MICERRFVKGEGTAVFCTFQVDEDRIHKVFRACLDEPGGDCVTASVYRSKDQGDSDELETDPSATTSATSTTTDEAEATETAEATEPLSETKSSPAEKQPPAEATHVPDATDRLSENAGPIMVGKAAYNPPYLQQYGQNVGDVLLDYHFSGFDATTTEKMDGLVDWYLDLAHAHMDDAEYGVVFDEGLDGNNENYANHPNNYHIQLAIQVYEVASQTLLGLTSLDDLLAIDYTKDMEESDKEKMVRLQYYAVLEYQKGEAYAVAAGGHSSTGFSVSVTADDSGFHKQALECYRRAQAAYEKLRYFYAKLSVAAAGKKSIHDDLYFNQGRYYLIETYYAHSSFQLGMSLYSQLVLDQNAQVLATNEKVMEMVKSQTGLRADASEDEIVQALMDQANGGKGTGGAAGGSSSFMTGFEGTLDSIEELSEMLGALGVDSEETNANLVEITTLLDTAILTYEQHAHPSKFQQQQTQKQQPSPIKDRKASDKERKFKLIVNGVYQKSAAELAEDERLFHWRASLATAYQNAAQIAAYRNQHIRSRELIQSALDLYTTSILPYYDERDRHEEQARLRTQKNPSSSTASPTASAAMSSMTRRYAEDSAGQLYLTLAETSKILGSYEDSITAYSKAMELHTDWGLSPSPSGVFNSLLGDEVSLLHYQDVIASYQQELDKYLQDLRHGYVYRDDMYEAQMLLFIAPLYMAMGKADPAIRYYKDSIGVHHRFVKLNDFTSDSNKRNLLTMTDARFGLASAYFHKHDFVDSQKEYVAACRVYQNIYGEGVPPKPEAEAAIEDMKDFIVENYGEDYYEKLKAGYGDPTSINANNGGASGLNMMMMGGDGNHPGGIGNNKNHQQKVATNFNVEGYHNETEVSLWDDDDEEEDDDRNEEDGATSGSSDEL